MSDEGNVLGAAITNNDVPAIFGLPPEMFGGSAPVYEFIVDYYMNHNVAPSIKLVQNDCKVTLPETTGATEHYIDKLRDSYTKKEIGKLLIKSNEHLDLMDAFTLVQGMQMTLRRLGSFSGSASDINMTDFEDAREYLRKLRESEDDRPGLKTGFKSIDASLPAGITRGSLVVVFGYSGMGKSLFTAKLGVNLWEQGKKVMVVSLEMSAQEYRSRVYAMMGSGTVKMSDLDRGSISEEDFNAFAESHLMDASDFVVVSTDGMMEVTPDFVRRKIDEYKPDIVICDYAQLMSSNNTSDGMTQRMMNLSRELKLTSVSTGVPIVLISSVTDGEGKKRNEVPQISAIAWSRQIEYDASLAIAVHKPEPDSTFLEIVSRKVRNGPHFDFVIETDIDSGVWTEKERWEMVI